MTGAATDVSVNGLGAFMLEVGTTLLRAGASTLRVRTNLQRIAKAYDCHLDDHIEARALSISLQNNSKTEVFNGTRVTQGMVINFKFLTGVSHMSWSISEKPWTELELWHELNRLKSPDNYPRLVVLGGAALAGSGFCFTYGGGPIELAITFVATFFGLFIKQELSRREFNPYLVTYLSAFSAGLVTVFSSLVNKDLVLEQALTTSVLYLIPGVQLINSVRDMMDGEVGNGVDRGMSALMHSMAIAFGLSTLIFLFDLH